MATVAKVREAFDKFSPFSMKLDFDNVGLLVGYCDTEVEKITTALDITDDVIDEAAENGSQLIVSHHPLIFDAIKKVTDDDSKGKKIIKMIENGISALCLHTNLDTAEGGVNDALMTALGGQVAGILAPHGIHPDGTSYGIGRYGKLLTPTPFYDFLGNIKVRLNCNGLRYHFSGRPVYKIACFGGAGAMHMEEAFNMGCDTYVTSDLKYHHFLWAKEFGLNLIDADHFCTENVVIPVIVDVLHNEFPEIEVKVAECHGQTIQFY